MAYQSHRLNGAPNVPLLKASKSFFKPNKLVSSLFFKKSGIEIDILLNSSFARIAFSNVVLLFLVA
jgi:hypothetical protein